MVVVVAVVVCNGSEKCDKQLKGILNVCLAVAVGSGSRGRASHFRFEWP